MLIQNTDLSGTCVADLCVSAWYYTHLGFHTLTRISNDANQVKKQSEYRITTFCSNSRDLHTHTTFSLRPPASTGFLPISAHSH